MHVILDNYAAHKHPKVIAWLARHPRVTFHFTPTSASWLNAVEGFFAARSTRNRSQPAGLSGSRRIRSEGNGAPDRIRTCDLRLRRATVHLRSQTGNGPLDQSQESGVACPHNHDVVRANTPIYDGVLQEDEPKSTGVKLSQGNAQIVLPRTSIVSGAPCHRPGSSANNLQIGTDLFVDFVERAIPQSGQLIQSKVHLRRFERSVAHHSKRSVCFGQNAISGHLRC